MEKRTMTITMTTLIFSSTIYGIPKAQPRARAFAFKGKARMYDPGTAEAWKGDVASQTKELHGKNLQGCIKVEMCFGMARPKSHYRSNGVDLKPSAPKVYYAKKPDADNLAKAVLDALTALNVWGDDDQVVVLYVAKKWADQRGGCHLTIYTINENDS
jgi:Holliday junction resolvase RusA-like endonuclease